MDKNKSAKVKSKKVNFDAKSLLSRFKGLRAKLILFIVVPVLITSIIAISAVAISVPETVNKIKKSEVQLQGDSITEHLENLKGEAERISQIISSDTNIIEELKIENFSGVKQYASMIANTVWNNNSVMIPEFVTITDSGGMIVAKLQYNINNKQYRPSMSYDGILLDTPEIIAALSGNRTSNYENNGGQNITLKIGTPIITTAIVENNQKDEDEDDEDEDEDEVTEETNILGVISVEFNLSNNDFIDSIKGDKESQISIFANSKRISTTFINNQGERLLLQQDLDKEIWDYIVENKKNYMVDTTISRKSYIGNYIPFTSQNGEVIGVIEVAVEKVDLSQLYIITSLTVLFITLGIIVIIVGIINKTILKPIQSLVTAADTLAQGDINVKLSMKNAQDEIGQLTKAFLKMSDNIKEQVELLSKFSDGDLTFEVVPKSERDLLGNNLKQMVEMNNIIFSEIISSAEQVASGAKQIADGSQALSQGTTEQASAIEELSESISKIASQTKMNAENANESKKLVNEILKNAEQGNSQMDQMLQSVQEINKASTEISKVIKVIDDIAFQTNILALNAAVEAARAGEYGKGFAVVAEEVRNLAAKSAMAAKETTLLIENSISKAKEGENIAKKTADAFDTIVVGVEKTTNIISQIALASNEQATSIAQVNQGVEQVSKVVQTNAATAEESAAASEEMSSQSSVLKDMISNKFKLKSLDKKTDMSNSDFMISDSNDTEAESIEEDNLTLDNSDFGKY